MKKSINNAVSTFKKMGRSVYEKVSFNTKPKAVTFETPVVKETPPPTTDYKPSDKKQVRTHEQILASMEMTVSNAEYKKDNMGTLTPAQQIERLNNKTMEMVKSHKAESHINNRKAEMVNEKYAITDTAISVSENQWYKILHPNTEDQYYLSFQKGKCYIVQHLSSIKMLVMSQESLMGLYGTAVEEHLPKSRFDSIVSNGPTVKTLSTIYRIVDIQRITDKPANEQFYNNPIPVYNVSH